MSFVMMILCGNVWFAYLVTQNPIPSWLFEVFRYTGYSIGLSAVLFIFASVFYSFFPKIYESDIEESESEENES
jgi:hypothetical protein